MQEAAGEERQSVVEAILADEQVLAAAVGGMVVGALTAPSDATTTLVHALVGAAVPLAVAYAMRVHRENGGREPSSPPPPPPAYQRSPPAVRAKKAA